MPPALVILVYLVKQVTQVAIFDVKRHVFPQIVDELGQLRVRPEIVLDDVPVQQELDVLPRVDQAVEQRGVRREVPGALGLALLERDAVDHETAHEGVDGDGGHLDHATPELDDQEAVLVAGLEVYPGPTELRYALDHVALRRTPLFGLLVIRRDKT